MGTWEGALRRLDVAGSPVEVAIDELMNGVAALGSDLVVVLDDFQAVTSRECLSSIDYAIAHIAGNMRIVVLTRVDPALSLARLRAGGTLAEVRGADLAFTAAEANELLTVLGQLELGAEEVDVLIERTEGWPAALVLAWLWLRTVDDPVRAVRAFGGEQRFVADYLSSEVLDALEDEDRAFLHERVGARRVHRGALRCGPRPQRLGGPACRPRTVEPAHLAAGARWLVPHSLAVR